MILGSMICFPPRLRHWQRRWALDVIVAARVKLEPVAEQDLHKSNRGSWDFSFQ